MKATKGQVLGAIMIAPEEFERMATAILEIPCDSTHGFSDRHGGFLITWVGNEIESIQIVGTQVVFYSHYDR